MFRTIAHPIAHSFILSLHRYRLRSLSRFHKYSWLCSYCAMCRHQWRFGKIVHWDHFESRLSHMNIIALSCAQNNHIWLTLRYKYMNMCVCISRAAERNITFNFPYRVPQRIILILSSDPMENSTEFCGRAVTWSTLYIFHHKSLTEHKTTFFTLSPSIWFAPLIYAHGFYHYIVFDTQKFKKIS